MASVVASLIVLLYYTHNKKPVWSAGAYPVRFSCGRTDRVGDHETIIQNQQEWGKSLSNLGCLRKGELMLLFFCQT